MFPIVSIDPREPIYAREQKPRLLESVRNKRAGHLTPILEAVDKADTLYMVVPQCDGPLAPHEFSLPGDRSSIVLLGDDYDAAFGPKGFHKPSVRSAIRSAADVVIVSSGSDTPVYGLAAAIAVLMKRPVVIIETRLEQEQPWIDFVRSVDVAKHITLSTVSAMGNA
ncbi:hypothetical protein [Inquilinus limosus]|uniref:Uncharacterized protein n=1 Tax=Inquilinus limosus MP06 TaxID=1398085 RepID=A0A0A0DCF5_9PROT|nr:hypothetical protein [Inquilinus limosus]KGM34687.1 hypothetical protein P409_08795 [Inquilinus limosus MP06]